MDVDHFCILIKFLSLFYILVLTILNSSNKLFWTRERDVDVVAGCLVASLHDPVLWLSGTGLAIFTSLYVCFKISMCIKCRNKQLLISLQFPHHILLTAIYCIACRMRITNFKSNSNHRLKTSVRLRIIILGQRGQRLRVDKIKNAEWPERLL
jgi:hypothetical protein